MKYHPRKRENNKKGFTLIETLVAITILLLAVVGPLTIAASSLESSLSEQQQITASYLAQEGLEYIKNVRDNEILNCAYYGSGVSPCPSVFLGDLSPFIGSRFDIDATQDPFQDGAFNTGAISQCTNSYPYCQALNYNSASGEYTHNSTSGNSPSQFTRSITLTPLIDSANSGGAITGSPYNEYKVSVTVSWVSPLPDHSVTLSEDITNWE